jgi:hypothetical protein
LEPPAEERAAEHQKHVGEADGIEPQTQRQTGQQDSNKPELHLEHYQNWGKKHARDRRSALSLASIITNVSGDKQKFFLETFPGELWDKYHADPDSLVAYFRENLDLIYWDRVFCVDHELKSLGIDSNRKVETLERLFQLLKDETHASTARRLLARYTDGHTSFDFGPGRDRIYFTDVGGYKFQVVPEGYLSDK